MADTNFTEINPSVLNTEDDATYQGDSFVTSGAAVNAFWDSATANKFFIQSSRMVAALARMMVGKGYSPVDGTSPFTAAGTPSTAVSNLATILANIITQADVLPNFPSRYSGSAAGPFASGILCYSGPIPASVIKSGSILKIVGSVSFANESNQASTVGITIAASTSSVGAGVTNLIQLPVTSSTLGNPGQAALLADLTFTGSLAGGDLTCRCAGLGGCAPLFQATTGVQGFNGSESTNLSSVTLTGISSSIYVGLYVVANSGSPFTLGNLTAILFP
jgi:hypothetical protein